MAKSNYTPVDHPEKPCAHCGNLFKPKTIRSHYCTSDCRKTGEQSLVANKSCSVCGDMYVVSWQNYSRSKYCSEKCKRTDNEGIKSCTHCGKYFIPARNSRGRYCSHKCYLSHTREVNKERPKNPDIRALFKLLEYEVSCAICETTFVVTRGYKEQAKYCVECRDKLGSSIYNGYSVEFLRDRLNGRECIVCGETFTPYNDSAQTCSSYCRWVRFGGKRPQIKQTKRKRIIERDKNTCWICGVHTPANLSGEISNKSPVVDHIVPLAVGGDHTDHNMACCCRRCNAIKSDGYVFRESGVNWFVSRQQIEGALVDGVSVKPERFKVQPA